MDCVVTGGAGFIGSNLVDALQVADVRDATAVSEIVAAAAPQLVFHMAAQIDVRYSVAPERPGEGRRSGLDVARARRELGWEPRVQLRDGLRTILTGL